ncbi:MAG: polyhydroxyalkanoic acid system family protein [Hyphomonadaceae bacterium]|nr:polyhydroxyalkanoic acid system family protein [Hyphomonadaceae bacterium]
MATPVTITLPHNLGKAEARARIERGFENMKGQLAQAQIAQFRQAWSADQLQFSASALGQRFHGRIDVGERDLKIEVDLPALLAGFAEKVRGKLKDASVKLLEKP